MPLFPSLRKRVPSEQMTGANMRIQHGVFGGGSPINADQDVGGLGYASVYSYHEGDLFSPGTGNWVFELNFELPLVTIWGKAFLRKPNTFNPFQGGLMMYANQNVVTNGIGGLQAGSIELEPLLYEGSDQGY